VLQHVEAAPPGASSSNSHCHDKKTTTDDHLKKRSMPADESNPGFAPGEDAIEEARAREEEEIAVNIEHTHKRAKHQQEA
jgi:hypothetical protein